MKKIVLCSLLVMALMLSMMGACAVSPDELTLGMVVEANATNALLGENKSYIIKCIADGEEALEVYCDDEVIYYGFEDYDWLITGDQKLEYRDGAHYTLIYLEQLFADPWDSGLFYDDPDENKLTAVQIGDRMILKTGIAEGEPEALESYTEYTYIVDAQNLQAIGYAYTEYTAEATDVHIEQYKMEWDVELPEAAVEMKEHLDAAQEYVTFTLVLDSGTDVEKTYSAKLVKGDGVMVCLDELDYEPLEEFYLDPECTQLYEGDGFCNEDTTLYQLSANIE